MVEIGACDAKTHLPKRLERVQRGERLVITKHGRPVAELVPVATRDVEGIRRAIAERDRAESRDGWGRRPEDLAVRDLQRAAHAQRRGRIDANRFP
ncbi:MAG: type II toxin-antitoxin system prevent-host-death family antitoxin [Burkholderiales bacterium]